MRVARCVAFLVASLAAGSADAARFRRAGLGIASRKSQNSVAVRESVIQPRRHGEHHAVDNATVCTRLLAATQRAFAVRPCGLLARTAYTALASFKGCTSGKFIAAAGSLREQRVRARCQTKSSMRSETSALNESAAQNESAAHNNSPASGDAETEVVDVKVTGAKVKVKAAGTGVVQDQAEVAEEEAEMAEDKFQYIAKEEEEQVEEELEDEGSDANSTQVVGVSNKEVAKDVREVAKDGVKGKNGLRAAQHVLAAKNLSHCVPAEAGGKGLPIVTTHDIEIVTARAANRSVNDITLQQSAPDAAGPGRVFKEGDMRLSTKQAAMLAARRQHVLLTRESASVNATDEPRRHSKAAGDIFPNGDVPYCFAAQISQEARAAWLQAVNHYHTSPLQGCISFREVGMKGQLCETGFGIVVQSDEPGVCWSDLGYLGKEGNWINLGTGCEAKGIVIHEIGHCLGMDHEQSRPDRDKFVQILWHNIKPGVEDQFELNSEAYTDRGYDFLSIMHYGSHTFSVDKSSAPTILPRDADAFVGGSSALGQMMGLSDNDILQLQDMYCPNAAQVSEEEEEEGGWSAYFR